PPDVTLGDRYNEPEVGLDEFALGLLTIPCQSLQTPALAELQRVELAQRREIREPFSLLATGLDPLGEDHFFRGREQRNASDFLQVHTHRVGRSATRAVVDAIRQQPARPVAQNRP